MYQVPGALQLRRRGCRGGGAGAMPHAPVLLCITSGASKFDKDRERTILRCFNRRRVAYSVVKKLCHVYYKHGAETPERVSCYAVGHVPTLPRWRALACFGWCGYCKLHYCTKITKRHGKGSKDHEETVTHTNKRSCQRLGHQTYQARRPVYNTPAQLLHHTTSPTW